MHIRFEQQAQRIHQNMTFASFHLFARIIAHIAFGIRSGFDRLAVDNGRAGLGLAALKDTARVLEVIVNMRPRPVPQKAPEITVDCAFGRKIPWHIRPGAAVFKHIQDGVYDAAQV